MRFEAAMWGLVGSGTTMAVRRAARKMMHADNGRPRLPQAARRHDLATFLAVAGVTGVILALADVLQEQRKRTAHVAAA